MHDTALALGKLFFETYLRGGRDVTVVEVGAADVNGALRSVAPAGCRYVGIDMAAGPGVDIVSPDPYSLPVAAGMADAVLSSSCLEHSEHFWLLFTEMQRILKPGGLCYINVPSNGMIHRYPVDCWRFYPDSGAALASWARRCGHDTVLLESFTARRAADQWNDFVAVFCNEGAAGQHPRRMADGLAVTDNLLRREADGSITRAPEQNMPEDMLIQAWQSQEIARLRSQLQAAQQTIVRLSARPEARPVPTR